jgi:hypothetical protein
MFATSKFLFRRLIGAAFVALALTLPQHGAFAASDLDTLDKGPAVGTTIPHQFNAPDQNNEIRDFSSLTGKNGLIVMFSRSFDW